MCNFYKILFINISNKHSSFKYVGCGERVLGWVLLIHIGLNLNSVGLNLNSVILGGELFTKAHYPPWRCIKNSLLNYLEYLGLLKLNKWNLLLIRLVLYRHRLLVLMLNYWYLLNSLDLLLIHRYRLDLNDFWA